MTKEIVLNQGAQRDFVNGKSRYSAFVGGLGSGKTFAGLARALKFTQQPVPDDALEGPKGCVAAINYPVLQDVVLPEFFSMVEDTGLLLSWEKTRKRALVRTSNPKRPAEILFRSLDRPNWMRGLKLSWFYLDEGRHLSRGAWDVLTGRLRQVGYAHAGWVCSTPNGYDWMWDVFHPDSPNRVEGAVWHGASTMDNRDHLPDEYIKDLLANYSGRFLRQEVYGEFVGAVQGAVFGYWNPEEFVQPVPYDPTLPLYSFWDFGIGDLQVCLFAQDEWVEKEVALDADGQPIPPQLVNQIRATNQGTVAVPVLLFVGALEGNNKTSAMWADDYHAYCQDHFDGREPERSFGDPAGLQRNVVTGTSVIEDLRGAGIPVTAARKRPVDYAIRILDNMMADSRVWVDHRACARLSEAFSSYRWAVDDSGQKTGKYPVHDWTSNYAAAARYGVTQLYSHTVRAKAPEPEPEEAPPGSVDAVFGPIDQEFDPEEWLGEPAEPVWPRTFAGVVGAVRV